VSTSDYVVSSYTPTLSALITARDTQRLRTCHDKPPKLLIHAQIKAEGLDDLPSALTEVEIVKSIVSKDRIVEFDPKSSHSLDPPRATQFIMDNLAMASILHLACHAHQLRDEPLESGFDLADGRLRLGQLMKLRASHGQLAYLSACESAAADETQPDEGINLAATMLFVGFSSVIATMWLVCRPFNAITLTHFHCFMQVNE
jgi:CHAT domain-containing protein